MKRRSVLSAFTICVIGGSGCLGQREDQVQLSYLSLINQHQQRHSVEVQIEDSGELVFSDTFQLQPEADDANITLQNPVTGPGDYEILVRLAGQSREVNLIEEVTDGQNCVGVEFTFTDDGTLENNIESSTDC